MDVARPSLKGLLLVAEMFWLNLLVTFLVFAARGHNVCILGNNSTFSAELSSSSNPEALLFKSVDV
jgi:hypothetical protein